MERVGEMLGLQAEGLAWAILLAVPARHRAPAIGHIQLHAGLGGPHAHHPAGFRLGHAGGGAQCAYRAAHDEVDVPDDVPLPVGDIEAVALALIVDDDVIVGLMVALNDKDGVTLAVSPKESVLLGVAVTVFDRLTVVDPLSLPLGV